ncbi:hypothetical protein [Mycobacterium conspicuum]|uniref:Uncharacterized protein n=1 Tax=Mycobacterium conspicuum TaxID=44010 RepID=A0A1X1T3M2_9MYCO|nr:hypothetical protein [Mycobacterium conspicuum]ORV39137.1 hypothetical protein AWC00_18670 [Mycobacterium conspicuum]BBZ39373.1 hypothetical protein MCNS_24360 [Mycobacterium conspicuum]CNJ02547.1 Uncharacterised protein [Mycobacterium tuberculosis]
MTTDPDQIRAEINALLAQLPDPHDMTAESENQPSLADLEQMARRLSEAHDVLLRALESAEKG